MLEQDETYEESLAGRWASGGFDWFRKAHAEISGVGKLSEYLLDSGDPVRFGPLIYRRVYGLSEWDVIDHCFWWLT